jgi:hypothetical protein
MFISLFHINTELYKKKKIKNNNNYNILSKHCGRCSDKPFARVVQIHHVFFRPKKKQHVRFVS